MSDGNPGAHLSAEVIDGTFALAREGRTGPLAEMIDTGVPVNTRNARGDTLLIVATYAEHSETVADLLRRGADVNAVNQAGQTAIACAVFRRDVDTLRALLGAGGDPDLSVPTAAQIADQFGLPEMKTVLDEAR
ncbi:ankyrin repeat domain-containing protein [Microbacterium sp. NPDC078428]|uniref:ankyrin repeat domain-containing protein n=1 Tax=Microbacterium sp. NPDC078428 TaxID=3364190 RepID=UPI0037C5EC65